MKRTIDTRRPDWPPRPAGHPVAARVRVRVSPLAHDGVVNPFTGAGTTNLEQTDERSR